MKMIREKLLIYPLDLEFMPAIRNKMLTKNFEIVGLCSPMGWGYVGKDAGTIDGGEPLDVIVESNYDIMIDNCDTVLFVNSENTINFDKLVYPKMLEALDKNKKVICLIELEAELLTQLSSKFSDQNRFKYYGHCKSGYSPEILYGPRELLKIDTPIVIVAGDAEKTGKFEVQLSLRESFVEMGYSVGQIGSRKYCELFGFHSFPGFMYGKEFSEEEKIFMFNRYVKSIEKSNNPDIIIIGIPGGIMPYNEKIVNNFGILAYEVSQAITPDVVVINKLFNGYTKEYIKLFEKSLCHRFGFSLDCFNISNYIYDTSSDNPNNDIAYIKCDSDKIDMAIKDFGQSTVPMFNIYRSNHKKEMAKKIIQKLIDYGEAGCL